MRNIIRDFIEGGAYSLPFLLHISDDVGESELFLINDVAPLEYQGKTYEPSNFTYTPSSDGSASLEIETVISDKIINMLENSKDAFHVDAVGIYNGEEVIEVSTYKNCYGKAVWTGKSLKLQLKKDERGDMTFPALIWANSNNRGNA